MYIFRKYRMLEAISVHRFIQKHEAATLNFKTKPQQPAQSAARNPLNYINRG